VASHLDEERELIWLGPADFGHAFARNVSICEGSYLGIPKFQCLRNQFA
jgi:hypothetical protein